MRFYSKVREFGALLKRSGVLKEVDDIFHLHHTEVDQALIDVMLAWASGSKPVGAAHWQPIVAERKRIIEKLKEWSPPPALGPMPESIEDPAVQMLWGLTSETLQA
jgi:pyruvate,water dikinase